MMTSPSPRSGALHFAASQGDLKELIRLVSENLAEVNERDYDRRTAMHVAAANGHISILEALCARGADATLVDRWNRTPLADAVSGNHVEAAEFLKQRAGLATSSALNMVPMLKQVSFKQVNPCSPLAALLLASAKGETLQVRDLLQAKQVDVNACDDDRRTAAHVAASEGKLLVLKVLAHLDVNFNAKDRMGNRPLDDAMRGGHNDCAAFLITRGAITSAFTAPTDSPSPNINIRKAQASSPMTLCQISKEALAELHNRGVREFWSWDQTDFKLEKEPFAKGAGGEVYKCRFRNMDCVAKTLGKLQSQQNLLDLSNEISLMSSIRHPNIVTFFGACFQMDEPVMLLEYCAGGNLETRIIRAYYQESLRRVRLSDSQKLKYAHQMALAMTFLHDFHIPIIHRDLKPGNVLLTANDDVKITDFGLAKFIPPQTDEKPAEPYKMTGETGSYRFMAPEVYEHRTYDNSVDMYSYAMIIYWLYSGVRPFADCRDGQDAVKLACRQIRPDTNHLKEAEILDLCEEGWAHDAQQRACFSTVADRLENCTIHGFTKVRRPSLAVKALSFVGGKSVHRKATRKDPGSESDDPNGGSETQEESKRSSCEEALSQPASNIKLTGKASPLFRPIEKRMSKFASIFA